MCHHSNSNFSAAAILLTKMYIFSDSSITIRTGGCFTGDSTVQLVTGETRPLSGVQLGDKVLAVNSLGHLVYDDVISFLHHDSTQAMTFHRLELANGRKLTLTADHLVYAAWPGWRKHGLAEPVFADRLQPGSYVFSPTGNASAPLEAVLLTNVSAVSSAGVYAPLTSHGTIVIDGVVTSCYASIDSQRLAHASMAPLRLMRYLYDLLWSSSDAVVATPGVHWYARALEGVAKYVLPVSLWYT